MFDVFLYQLACAIGMLEQLAGQHKKEIANVESVISALGSLSGMEEVIGILNQTKERMEQHQQGLLSMAQGLAKIRMLYERAERRICDNAEGCRYTFTRIDILLQPAYFLQNEIEKVPIVV